MFGLPTLRAVVSPRMLRYKQERNHCEQPFAFPSSMHVHMTRCHVASCVSQSRAISNFSAPHELNIEHCEHCQQDGILKTRIRNKTCCVGRYVTQKARFGSCPKSLSIKNACVFKHMLAQCDENDLLYTRLQNKMFKTYFLHEYLSYGNV